jgi:hypothetical protein
MTIVEHDCDDTAYSAAAMSDECMCPQEDRLSEEDLERRAARIRIWGEDPEQER